MRALFYACMNNHRIIVINVT